MSTQEERCLYCYEALRKGEIDFHSTCSKKFFGTAVPPIVDFSTIQLEGLAKLTIVHEIAVTGIQSKLSLGIKNRKDEISLGLSVSLNGGYILKPTPKGLFKLSENEDLTMHLAEIAKIKTAQHSLIRLHSGELAYITKRFDRDNNGNKIAMEDMCQLTNKQTELKYLGSVEKIAEVTRRYTTNKGLELVRLFELVVFCYLTGNANMHLKNFSLIENSFGEYELSPAYDLLNTALTEEKKRESALTINRKRNHLMQRDFEALAAKMGISEMVFSRISKRFSKILTEWTDFVEKSFLRDGLKKEYVEILKERHKKLFPETALSPKK